VKENLHGAKNGRKIGKTLFTAANNAVANQKNNK
jgi:hypothetical protein